MWIERSLGHPHGTYCWWVCCRMALNGCASACDAGGQSKFSTQRSEVTRETFKRTVKETMPVLSLQTRNSYGHPAPRAQDKGGMQRGLQKTHRGMAAEHISSGTTTHTSLYNQKYIPISMNCLSDGHADGSGHT